MPSVARRRGRHRAPSSFANFITPYVLIAVLLTAIFTSGWYGVEWILTPRSMNAVGTVPQSEFTAQYPALSSQTPGEKKRCRDFYDQDDAQKYFIALGGPESDPDDLDLDNDGQACENYPYPTSSHKAELNDQQS